jgi:hypothetical protein
MHKTLTLYEIKIRIEHLYDLLEENTDEMRDLVDSQSKRLKKDTLYLGLKYCVKSNPCLLCPHNFEWRYVREESYINPKTGQRKGMAFGVIKLSPSGRITKRELRIYRALHMRDIFKELDDKKDAIMRRRKILTSTIKEISQVLQSYETALRKEYKKEEGEIIFE